MFGFGMFHENPGPFNRTYRCYSVSMVPGPERQEIENGGKIILPPSALEHLTRLNVVYPMLFKITNPQMSRVSHCGVLEFVADEGRCYIPYWMMRNLMCDEGAAIQIESATLPVASYSKFEPQSQEFLEISNPKAMLENALRTFACLTTGDMIAIRYNNKIYELRVLETKPGNAVSIIECDMEVDFAKPVDYEEPVRPDATSSQSDVEFQEEASTAVLVPSSNTIIPFQGQGNRLDGKEERNPTPSISESDGNGIRKIIPDYNWKMGSLDFYRGKLPLRNDRDNNNKGKFSAFTGQGSALSK